MSNRYNGKLLVIDTTDAQIGGPNPTGGPKGPLNILAIKWVGTEAKPIIQNNDLIIDWNNSQGDIAIASRAQLAAPDQIGYSVEFGQPGWIVSGLFIDDIDGGELQVFLA